MSPLQVEAGAKRSRAVIAGARIDLVENDRAAFFLSYFAMIQSVNMITTMAMNCSSTRSRMSFCDVLPEPPRIILMRPRSSTVATAPMAIGTDTWDMKSAMPAFIYRLSQRYEGNRTLTKKSFQ